MSAPEHLGIEQLHSWLVHAHAACVRHGELLNTLNEFPVADSDTGANVTHTLAGAARALTQADVIDFADAATVASAGAVLGARGNSGMILAQCLLAFSESAQNAPSQGLRPVELVAALQAMARGAVKAVSHPVEGTFISAMRSAAQAGADTLDTSPRPTLEEITATAAFGAQEAVVETVGIGHGPVDAGAGAIMLIMTALADVFNPQGDLTGTALNMLTDLSQNNTSHKQVSGHSGEFEVMYLWNATAFQAERLRKALGEIGQCGRGGCGRQPQYGFVSRACAYRQPPRGPTALR